MGETNCFEVGDQVMINAPKSKAHGLVGDVVGKRESVIGIVYEVDFHQDISQFTNLKKSATVMCVYGSDLVKHHDDLTDLQADDYDELIDTALKIKDEYWFHELIARKQHCTANKIF